MRIDYAIQPVRLHKRGPLLWRLADIQKGIATRKVTGAFDKERST